MRESERTVLETATRGNARERGVCSQLVSDPARYSQWFACHSRRMLRIGRLVLRQPSQIRELRRACVEDVHGAALVRALSEFDVSREERDRILCLFCGVTDAREAAVLEHRNYLQAATSQLCMTELLALAGDTRGVKLIRRYERAYGQYFRLLCEQARSGATHHGRFLDKLQGKVKRVVNGLLDLLLADAPRPASGDEQTTTTATERSAA